uniref:Uncharacterized protein n=1 Tax=Acanthochromis polyacanthus TaxID=80966 RepID=A0A3Q1GLI6_9TELE
YICISSTSEINTYSKQQKREDEETGRTTGGCCERRECHQRGWRTFSCHLFGLHMGIRHLHLSAPSVHLSPRISLPFSLSSSNTLLHIPS